MCREKKYYPIPHGKSSIYVKPYPDTTEKRMKKMDDKIVNLLTQVSTERINSKLLDLCSFHTRHTKSNFVNHAADWLMKEFKSIGYSDVFFHNYTESIDGDPYDLKNIICTKKGKNNKYIIICAHYDSRMKNLRDSISRAPGANDNASGVCSVLELANILHKQELDYNLQFVLFSGEEQGLLGSANYTEFVKENNIDIHRLINLDMIGYPLPDPGIIIIERDNHTEREHNRVKGNDQESIQFAQVMADMSVYTNITFKFGSINNSDYEPFEAEGYIVTGAYDGSAEPDKNPHYHDITDTPDLIDWSYLTSVTKMLLATVVTAGKTNH